MGSKLITVRFHEIKVYNADIENIDNYNKLGIKCYVFKSAHVIIL